MEIKVNDYVRTKSFGIKKGEYFRTERGKIHQWSKGRTYIGKDKITKHSKNIIDLIEVGDYVNGCRITYINEPNKYNAKRILNYEEPEDYVLKTFDNEDIKSIVTKEMFEQIKYKIESEVN